MADTATSPPPEWRIADGLTPYADAVAFMQERVAAIRAGTAPELVWLVEHPPLYTGGTSARAGATDGPRPVSHLQYRPRRPVDLPRARASAWRYVMLDLTRPHGTVPARDVRCYVQRAGGMADPRPRPLQRARRAARRAASASGSPTGWHRGQDRRHRRARQPLGELARRRVERRAGPGSLRRHRSMRHQRIRRHQPARARHHRHHGGCRYRPARGLGRGVQYMDVSTFDSRLRSSSARPVPSATHCSGFSATPTASPVASRST